MEPNDTTSTSSDPILAVQGLYVHYDKIPAIKNVSFELGRGEIVSLLGANGAGKTTILRTLSRLHRQSQGRIFFKGEDVSAAPSHELVRKGLIHCPEGRMIFANMTVAENLAMGAFAGRLNAVERNQELEAVLSLFPRLAERLRQQAATLSGGEQQMLAMGRALMAKPEVLLLDEPSLGIAPIFVELILATIGRIRAQGVAILLVEQNANLALKVVDRCYLVQQGEITHQGSPSYFLNNETIRQSYFGE